MIYDESVIGSLFKLVDQYGSEFVSGTYHNLVSSYSSIIYLFAAIYVGFVFLEVKRGVRESRDLPFIILRMVAILTVTLNYNYFCLFIYNVFTNGPLYLCKAITLNGANHLEPMNVGDALDNFLKGGLSSANKLFSMGSWTNIIYTIFGCMLFLATIIAVAIATGLIFLAKIASTVILSLSPLFIFFALYESTKGWFDSYLQHLFTYALIPILTCAVLMIVLSVSTTTIQYMNSDKPTFRLLIPFFIACLVQIWLFLQIPQKCASLASGFNLKGLMSSFGETQASVRMLSNIFTGGKYTRGTLIAASKTAGNLMKQGGSAARSYFKNTLSRFSNADK